MTVDRREQNDPVPVVVDVGGPGYRPMGRFRDILEKPKSVRWILAGVLVIAAAVYVSLLRPEGFGAYHDDGIYAVLAKALATGKGYKLISLPLEPDQTKSPPFYPLLLSLIWRLYPQFPQNVPFMMLLSVAATVGFLLMAWSYLVGQGYTGPFQALIIVTLAALNWRTIILATGVYSEMVYALLSVVALFLAEKHEKEGKRTLGVALGAVMGLAFLARSSGVALPVAIAAYYLARRRWRKAVIPVLVSGLFVLGWLLWGRLHRPPVDSINAGYYESYLSTLSQVIGGDGHDLAATLTNVLSLIAKNGLMLIFITTPVVCLGLGYDWTQNLPGYLLAIGGCLFVMTFMFLIGGFFRFRNTGFRLLHAYVGAYVLIHILWPYAAYDRFLMPLLPWLMFFLLSELNLLARSAGTELAAGTSIAKKFSAALIGMVLFLLAGLAVYNVQAGIRTQRSSGKEKARFQEDDEAIRWLNANSDSSDVVVCYRDPTYYLYTGRKAIRSISAREGGLTQESDLAPDEQVKVIFQIIAESRARFLVVTSTDFEQEDQADLKRAVLKALIKQNPLKFVPVFESADGGSRLYRIEDSSG